MRRRALLAATVSITSTAFAGCLGRNVEENNGTLDVGGTEVPLVATSQAYEWYEDDEEDLLVLDARSEEEWEDVRIAGAFSSPAPDGHDTDDPTDGVDPSRRILTYCVCPHTYAGQRAASLIDDGFESVHALDEGLEDWMEQGYPIEGDDVGPESSNVEVPEPDYHE